MTHFLVPEGQHGLPDDALCFHCRQPVTLGDMFATITSLRCTARVYLCHRCHRETFTDAQVQAALRAERRA